MRKVSGGFTIMEVVLVLAVSTIILGAAILTISGTSARTQFAQSMRDVNSSTQDWINDVTDGFTGGTPSQQACNIVSGKPRLVPTGAGNNVAECVFLGKAIQFTNDTLCAGCSTDPKQSTEIFIYSIFGERNNGLGALIDNLSEANPIPAVGDVAGGVQTGNRDLTDTYHILNSASVKKIIIDGTPRPGALIGFFNSFNGATAASGISSNGSQTLNTYYYPIGGNWPAANIPAGDHIAQCLEMSPSCLGGNPPNPPPYNKAQICFTSNSNNQLAVLTITSNNSLGAQTKLDFVDTCP